jgi:dolichol-phosphate mannosyltransferase
VDDVATGIGSNLDQRPRAPALVPEPGRREAMTEERAGRRTLGTTWVCMPTYNEAENLRPMAEALFGLGLDLVLLVIDDSSPDGTAEIAKDLMERWPGRVHLIQRPGKLGLGTAYLTGFRYALEHGAGQIVEMDADFSHSPAYLPRFLERIAAGCDVVIGSRWMPGGGVDKNWELWRKLLSQWANVYARLVTGLEVYDTTAGYKCFRREALEAIDLTKIRSDGYAR